MLDNPKKPMVYYALRVKRKSFASHLADDGFAGFTHENNAFYKVLVGNCDEKRIDSVGSLILLNGGVCY